MRDTVFAPRIQQIEIDFAAADQQLLDLGAIEGIDIVDHVLELALLDIRQSGHRKLVPQQRFGAHHDEWLAVGPQRLSPQ